MHTRVLGLILIAWITGSSSAQNWSFIPSDSPKTGVANGFPFGAYFGTNWRYQVHLDARHLPAFPARITDVAFAAARSPAGVFAASEFQLRLAHTTRSSPAATFADNFTSPPIVIHHGPHQYAPAEGAWRDLGFRGSFAYDGRRSLVLEIRYRGRTSGCTYLQGVNSIPRVWANSDTGSPDPFAASVGRAMPSDGLKTRLTWIKDHVLLAPDSVTVGNAAAIQLLHAPPGADYRLAASLGQAGIDLPPHRIYLSPDGLFVTSVLVLTPVFQGFAGSVAIDGSAAARLSIPAVPALSGITIYTGGITLRAGQIVGVTNAAAFRIR